MESRWLRGILAFAAAAAGCSPADSPGGARTDSRAFTNGPPSSASVGSAGSGSGGSTADGFGNATTAPMTTPARGVGGTGAGMAGDGCIVGQFCASTNPDQGCGSLTLETKVKTTVVPGNALIIFDRSISMSEDWSGMPRWQAAGNAVINALTPVQDLLTIGAVMFPSPNAACADPNICMLLAGRNPAALCNVNPITAADQVNFKPGPMAIMELQSGSNGAPKYQPIGATPTSEAVAMADMALSSAMLAGNTVVILITDGEPNCQWNQQTTTTTVANWLAQKNIKTYVVGLPGVAGIGPQVLNAIAQAGGTDMYLTPSDSMTLETKVHEIVAQTITSGFDSCEIDLMPPTTTPEKLQLVVTEPSMPGMEEAVPHDLGGTAGGWTISMDGTHVSLSGGLCNSAKSGRFTTLKFKFGCKDIPVIPPAHVT